MWTSSYTINFNLAKLKKSFKMSTGMQTCSSWGFNESASHQASKSKPKRLEKHCDLWLVGSQLSVGIHEFLNSFIIHSFSYPKFYASQSRSTSALTLRVNVTSLHPAPAPISPFHQILNIYVYYGFFVMSSGKKLPRSVLREYNDKHIMTVERPVKSVTD